MFQEIITPLDGSEYGERALAYTQNLAKIAGARVTLLSVSSPSESTQERVKRQALTYLEEQAASLRDAGLPDVATEVRFGEPALLITHAARELQADVIVMSTQGLGADGSYALGSVALQVLMTAPCPVFMVRINKPVPPRTLAEERWQGEGGSNVG